jgi:hypothetical protein
MVGQRTFLNRPHRYDIGTMKVDRMCIDRPQRRRRVYCLDRDYDDVLEESVADARASSEVSGLPKIANGKSNGMMILVESIVSVMQLRLKLKKLVH